MKELDKTKAYDLRDLSDEQLKEFKQECRKQGATTVFNESAHKDFCKLIQESNVVLFDRLIFEDKFYISKRYSKEVINALTLFEPTLKIGDTFERDGFICEVKEPVKKWYMVTYNSGNTVYKRITKAHYEILLTNYNTAPKEITDQEFIKQLEKHAK